MERAWRWVIHAPGVFYVLKEDQQEHFGGKVVSRVKCGDRSERGRPIEKGKLTCRFSDFGLRIESMTIRPARVGDIVVIMELAERIWRTSYAGMISDEQIDFMLGWMYAAGEIEDQMSRGVRWGMGEIDGGAVGYFSFEKEADGRVKISKVYLLESAQRRGLGRAMLEFIGGEALAMGATSLWLQVNKRNTVAMGAYRKAGFAVTGEGIFSIGGGYVMDDYLMSKEIGEMEG